MTRGWRGRSRSAVESLGVSWLVAAMALVWGCAATSVPDPDVAARSYAAAAVRGDGAALYAMMTAASRRARSEGDAKQMIADEREELAEQGRDLQRPDLRVDATARLRYADGEEAALDLRNGRYYVTAAGTLPGGARTPEQALDQLRRVLARRSYPALMRVLSPATRAAVESDMRALVDGLTQPETLPVQVDGDAAVVSVPGGHEVKLKRDAGVWRVEDFD